ncbi:GNAT family N-acetyltransferase [Paenibacillus wulumuqiensis]|uniref:GNAT family N-acetyltransferase n=1 Tax=Paenibacillus wulumuqiensis TaxID=1567107 RepID=UPI000619674F|nr:GNAT family protein [Paenibacillus wulumuqiensis]
MKLETSRLWIRELVMDDWTAVHTYASDLQVTRHTIWGPNTEQDTLDYVESILREQQQEPRTVYEMAVIRKENSQLIGGCGLHLSSPGQAEIGYCYHPDCWGQGYASEAAQAMLEYGFGQLDLHRIYARCRPENTGSAKVMQKIGMTYEGHLRGHMYYKQQWRDSYQYSILQQEFRARTSGQRSL